MDKAAHLEQKSSALRGDWWTRWDPVSIERNIVGPLAQSGIVDMLRLIGLIVVILVLIAVVGAVVH